MDITDRIGPLPPSLDAEPPKERSCFFDIVKKALHTVGKLFIPSREPPPPLHLRNITPHRAPRIAFIPGIDNLINAPRNAINSVKGWIRAKARGDIEGQTDSAIQLASAPLSLSHAVLAAMISLSQIGHFLRISAFEGFEKVLLPATGLGLGLCAVEICYEGFCINRQLSFFKDLHTNTWKNIPTFFDKNYTADEKLRAIATWRNSAKRDLKKIEKLITLPTLNKHLEKIDSHLKCSNEDLAEDALLSLQKEIILTILKTFEHTYLRGSSKKSDVKSLQDEEQNKQIEKTSTISRTKLARRISPHLVGPTEGHVKALITILDKSKLDQSTLKAMKSFSLLVEKKAKEKLRIHLIGVAAFLLAAAALLAPFLTPIFFIPLILFGISILLAYTRAYLYKQFDSI